MLESGAFCNRLARQVLTLTQIHHITFAYFHWYNLFLFYYFQYVFYIILHYIGSYHGLGIELEYLTGISVGMFYYFQSMRAGVNQTDN